MDNLLIGIVPSIKQWINSNDLDLFLIESNKLLKLINSWF